MEMLPVEAQSAFPRRLAKPPGSTGALVAGILVLWRPLPSCRTKGGPRALRGRRTF